MSSNKSESPVGVKMTDEHIENYIWENGALYSKLQAKAEALKILAKDLDRCRTERDQFKLMAEQLQERYVNLRRRSHGCDMHADVLDCERKSGTSVARLLSDARELNKTLRLELESTRQRLAEAVGDVAVLRRRTQRRESNDGVEESFRRGELVEQLEKLNIEAAESRADVRSLIDEKEELVRERDAFKRKAHRVGHELSVALRLASDGAPVDGDALISENRYLHERLRHAEAETRLATQALAKYKGALETKRRKGAVRLGTEDADTVVSHGQVKRLLERGAAELPATAATVADMRSLCLGLLEALEDKTLALAHQRKANKILATRVTELETRVENVSGVGSSAFPSQVLLDDYRRADADRYEVGDEPSAPERATRPDEKVRARPDGDGPTLPPKLQTMVRDALAELRSDATNDVGRGRLSTP